MHYLYLLLGGGLFASSLAIGLVRPDLWRTILTAGPVGAVVESTAEIWYLQDYWRPPTLLELPTPEDLLYGFGVTSVAACCVPLLLRRRYRQLPGATAHYASLGYVLAGFVVIMTLVQHFSPLNSIWIATGYFAAIGLILAAPHPNLVGYGLLTAVVMGTLALGGYWFGLNVLIDGQAFLNRVLLIRGTRWDIRILGQVPLDEVIWNLTRGWCVGIVYPYVTGKTLLRTQP